MANEQRLIDANKIKYKEYRSGGGRDYPENIVSEYEIAKMPTVNAVVLPCKIGDTVYRMLPYEDFVMECTVVEFSITARAYMIVREKQFNARRGFDFNEIGKSVFLTREEAENAIRERRCNSGK